MKWLSGCALFLSILLSSAIHDSPAEMRGILVPVGTSEGRTIDLYRDSYACIIRISTRSMTRSATPNLTRGILCSAWQPQAP